MPQIETWPRIPAAIRDHLVERMHDRNVGLDTSTVSGSGWRQGRMSPKLPGSKISARSLGGEGKYPKTFLLAGQAARGEKL
jgi:hypothetical protein